MVEIGGKHILWHFMNIYAAYRYKEFVVLQKIVPDGADRTYEIHIAQLGGLPLPVIQRASEIMAELEKTSGRAVKIDPQAAQHAMLFPETSPLLEELKEVDINSLSPIEALNKLFEWQKKFMKQLPATGIFNIESTTFKAGNQRYNIAQSSIRIM